MATAGVLRGVAVLRRDGVRGGDGGASLLAERRSTRVAALGVLLVAAVGAATLLLGAAVLLDDALPFAFGDDDDNDVVGATLAAAALADVGRARALLVELDATAVRGIVFRVGVGCRVWALLVFSNPLASLVAQRWCRFALLDSSAV